MNERYLTVSALTKYIRRKFEMDNHLKQVWLKGEISNFKHHSRGHMYLTIKDERSRVQAVMFAGHNKSLKFAPENGMNVLIKGEIGVYEPQGQYQLYIHHMEPDGIGALYLAFEQLKEKLEKEGLFDSSIKTPLPTFPLHIGVLTSPTGAAVRDIITTIRRRYPIVKVTVLPVLVQGEQAPKSIVKALQKANEMNSFDVLILGRGGGSIEELWGFNEEIVARAIIASRVPIISAVGHETDFTISDFVSDMRAATPTGAAELAVPSQMEMKEKVQTFKRMLDRNMVVALSKSQEKLAHIKRSYAFRYPEQLLKQKEQELDKLGERLRRAFLLLKDQKTELWMYTYKRLAQQHPENQVKQARQQISSAVVRNNRAMVQHKNMKQQRFESSIDKLTLLNPLETIKRGYAIPFRHDGLVVKSTKNIEPGDQISLKLKDGSLDCQIWGIEEDEHE